MDTVSNISLRKGAEHARQSKIIAKLSRNISISDVVLILNNITTITYNSCYISRYYVQDGVLR